MASTTTFSDALNHADVADKRGEAFSNLLDLQQRQSRFRTSEKSAAWGSGAPVRPSKRCTLLIMSLLTVLALYIDTAVLSRSNAVSMIWEWLQADTSFICYVC